MVRSVARIALAGLAAGLPALAPAQVMIGLGAGAAYGPFLGPVPVYGLYAPLVVVPYPRYGYGYAGAGLLYRPPRTDALPSCYRIGRCTLEDLYALGGRPDRLDRLAPTAPDPPHAGRAFGRPANVPPTAENEIQPQYRGASVPRDEFKDSGTPR